MSLMSRLRHHALCWTSRTFLPVNRNVPVEKLGSSYGGWYVPSEVLGPDSISYCVGVGEDITFDLELIRRFDCDVHAFDPTPRAIAHVAGHAAGEPRYHFSPEGVWSSDKVLLFYAPANPAQVSHSVVNLQGTSDYFEAPCRSIKSLMEQRGHTRLDLLKLDVEGAEYEVLESLNRDQIFPTVLCLEFDQPQPYLKTISAIRKLLRSYELVAVDGWNFTFLRRGATVSSDPES